MNLDSCTSGQRQIITTLNKPLMVSAGAGSGKTFTLTQRIAYALEGEEGGAPFLDSISQVMAITFTKKAAAELKSRIKAKLMSMGLVEEALKVDDAWISTIHGACSRILREHALELGIDPAFSVVSATEEEALHELAFDNVMKRLEESEDEDLKAFVRKEGAEKIENQVESITGRALSLPNGFDAVVVPRVEGNPSQIMRQQIERGETLIKCIDALPKIEKNDTKARFAAQDALVKAQDYMDGFGNACAFDAPGLDVSSFADAFYAFPKTVKNSHTKESDPTFFAEYRIEYAQASAQVEAALSAIELGYLMRLARAIDEEYQQAKGASALDNTDLLRLAYQALCQNPEIAAAYRSQFKLIMIDEFQDTDELQVALIGALAEEGYSNVCTVGDAQQSIYRFRGADVNVFFGYREMLQRECPETNFVNLPDNFRSHADVLSFVDKVFSQPQVFGEHFLSLAPKGAVNNEPDPLFNTNPRVSMAVYDCQKGGPSTNDARALCAERIAQHFEQLREGGASAGEMVILLGGMSNVDLYAQALRNHGFECLVAGGSTFGDAYEVGLVVAMVRYFANRADDSVLFELLESPLFAIGGTGMLHLVTGHDRQSNAHRRTLSAGLHAWPDEKGLTGLGPEQEDQIDFAHLCLAQALAHAKANGLGAGVRALLRASGWLLRLEKQGAEGQAVVGNLGKALRMLDENQKQGMGLVRSANLFCADIETLKLTPGALSASDSNFVRIMTIHSSKGLEFPHVAIADLRLTTQAVRLVAENIQGNTYLSMSPVCLHAYSKTVIQKLHEFLDGEEAAADSIPEADYTARMRLLKKRYSLQELSEQRRLLYVALTRASKSLFVAMAAPSNRNLYTSNGVFKDMYEALQWEASETAPQQKLNYGGSAPMAFELHVLTEPAEEQEGESLQEQPFLIPGAPLGKQPFSEPYRVQHPEVFSYSSIAPHSPVVPVPAESFELDASAGLEDQDATALGTAFHRLAQLAIVQGEGKLACPSAEAVAAQVSAQGLSAQQALRLDAALQLWFNSGVAQQLAAHGKPQAEVPFMLCIPSAAGRLYLEGEIDAVSFNDAGEAFLVDYKTGGTAQETSDCLQQKHLLQAQCYALALLRQGVPCVRANFVRVERESAEEPGQPQVVRYSFDASQAEELQRLVLLAYAQSLE
jgi:ATP-dependent helicase/nuclease subunit A